MRRRRRSRPRTAATPTSDWNQGYGYQFWRCRHGFYRGDGAFGQFCFVLQQYDAVIAVTSGTSDMQGVMNVVWDKLLPAFSPSALPADPESDRRLSEKLASLSLRTQQGAAASPAAQGVAGRRYTFPDNPQKIEAVSLEPAKDGANAVLTIRIAGSDQRIECGQGAWAKGAITLDSGETFPEAASGAWTSDDTYSVTPLPVPDAFLHRVRLPVRRQRADSRGVGKRGSCRAAVADPAGRSSCRPNTSGVHPG